jgi:hypothetical protein
MSHFWFYYFQFSLKTLIESEFYTFHFSHTGKLITNYSQQDATFLAFISSHTLHVVGRFSAHHQEHITVHTASGIVNQ